MSADAAPALLRAIRDDPDDDLPRLALADWLDESDDPDRAEFIRVQVELARLPDHDPARPPLEDREHDLLAANEPRWIGDAGGGLVEWEFRRGFVDEVVADPVSLTDRGPDLFAAHPIRRWRVMGSADSMHEDLVAAGRTGWARRLEAIDLWRWYQSIGEFERFLTRSDLPRLRELDLHARRGLDDLPEILGRSPFAAGLKVLRCGGQHERLDVDDLGRALAPHGTGLAELTARACLLTADDVGRFLASPLARDLNRLRLTANDLAPDGWAAFGTTRCQLRHLDLSGTPLGATSLGQLLGCHSIAGLRGLEVSHCGSEAGNVRALVESRFWRQAEEVHLSYGVAENALRPIFSAGPTALRVLHLGHTFLRDEGVALLCEAPWAGGLSWLSLDGNDLTDVALRTLARSGRFTNLRTLHLRENHTLREGGETAIGDPGVLELASHPSLANVRHLDLSSTRVTAAGIDAALNSPHWRLIGLELDMTRVGPDDVTVLANSPGLTRLRLLRMSGMPVLDGDVLMPLAESPLLSPVTELYLSRTVGSTAVRQAFRERLGWRFRE